jgi:hypothetical protein
MNVKISYTIPFDEVPERVNELLTQAGRSLEAHGQTIRPNSFDDNFYIFESLEKIDKVRKHLNSIDLLLQDCYTILAAYNKTLAELKIQQIREEPTSDAMAVEGRLSSGPSKGTDNKV